VDLLDRLLEELDGVERQWRRLGAPIVDGLRPGLPLDKADAIAAASGWELPLELRVLWNWHDGAEATRQRSIGPGGFEFLSLTEALAETKAQREAAPDSPDQWPAVWRSYWLIVMTQGPQRLYADCRTSEPFHSPRTVRIGMVPWEWEDADRARAGSLLEAVSLWRWLLEEDYYAVAPHGDLFPTEKHRPIWLRINALA
jgi:hypothetical protein